MIQNLYAVSIAAVPLAAPRNGFIDPISIQQYMAQGSSPTTLAQSEAKTRANIRFMSMVETMQVETNLYIDNVETPGANAVTEPSQINFVVIAEKGEDDIVIADENNPGAYLTGIAAIRRMIARSLTHSRDTRWITYDPVPVAAPGNSTLAVRVGYRFQDISVGKIATSLTTAESYITITKIF